MRGYFIIVLLIPHLCFAQFKSSDDTIVFSTVKQQDSRPYLNSITNIPESKNNCSKRSFPGYKCIPDTLDSISIFITTIDSKQAFYQCYKNGLINDKSYLDTILSRLDTTGCHSRFINTYISVLTGWARNGKLYYIPETNNNFNFCDEKAYELKKTFGFRDSTCLKHLIVYEKFRENDVVLDSTYLSVNRSIRELSPKAFPFKDSIRLKYLDFKFYESRYGEFTLNKKTYKVTIKSSDASYNNMAELIFYRDTVDFSKQLWGCKLGAYIYMNNKSYRIAQIKYNGEEVVLVKGEKPGWQKSVTQLKTKS